MLPYWWLLVLIAMPFINGLLGIRFGKWRGDGKLGFSLGFFYGPFGWILAAVAPDKRADAAAELERWKKSNATYAPRPPRHDPGTTTPCPHCRAALNLTDIKIGANTCPACGQVFNAK